MSLPSRIKAVFFDLDGTLRHSVPSSGEVFSNYAASLGLRVTYEDRIRAARWEYLYWANSADLRDDLLAHSPDTENFWTEYSRRRLIALGAPPAQSAELSKKISAHMGEEYKPQSVIPGDVREVLVELQRQGCLMAVLSNREKPFQDVLDSHGISDFFAFAVAACEVDSYKPEPGLFEHALNRTGLSPQEAVYVGDNYFADVIGSRRAGLQPVLFDPDVIFPEADCVTIRSFKELHSVLRDG